jgi:hypothetical protein
MPNQLRCNSWVKKAFWIILSSSVFSLNLRPDAPEQYTVKQGDTLWSISGRYLKSPWQWPKLWGMNRQDIKNPHLIYPGDVLFLEYGQGGVPRLRKQISSFSKGNDGSTVKLSPTIRESNLDPAISSLSPKALSIAFKRPLVVDLKTISESSRIISGPDERVVFTRGDKVYTTNLPKSSYSSNIWQIYRPNKELKDPDTGKILGFEVRYAGEARFDKDFGSSQRLIITYPVEEIMLGDYITEAPDEKNFNYAPHAPEHPILNGKIISSYNGVTATAQYDTVVINKGMQHGIELGHVLGVFKKSRSASSLVIDNSNHIPSLQELNTQVQLPKEQAGYIMVYRVFDEISYALVLRSTMPLYVGDDIGSPEDE